MNFVSRALTSWQLRTRALSLGARTLVMGVVNITPDSFSDGGSFLSSDAAVAHALRLIDDGADILDLGAESTRPGSHAGGQAGSAGEPAVSADEEQARLLPGARRHPQGPPRRNRLRRHLQGRHRSRRDQCRRGNHQRRQRFPVGPRPGNRVRREQARRGADAYARPPRGVAHPAAACSRSRSRDRARRPRGKSRPCPEIRNSLPTRFCSIPATASANASAKTTPCSHARRACSRWAGLCSWVFRGNPSSATLSLPSTVDRPHPSRLARLPAWQRWLPPSSVEHRLCACTPCALPSKPRTSPTLFSPPAETRPRPMR